VYFVDTIEVPGLGNRGYLAGGAHSAVAVDPPRDIDQVITAAARSSASSPAASPGSHSARWAGAAAYWRYRR
jgi:hypothetical protein